MHLHAKTAAGHPVQKQQQTNKQNNICPCSNVPTSNVQDPATARMQPPCHPALQSEAWLPECTGAKLNVFVKKQLVGGNTTKNMQRHK